MLKQKALLWLVPIATALNLMASPAQANCSDPIANIDAVQPLMQRHWQQLQQQTNYPWGTVRPFASISGRRITLTPEFDRLTGAQKQQVLTTLINVSWRDLMTPEEIEALESDPMMFFSYGASPYEVYSSDGRAVSLQYDGCTRNMLLTERARYSWYYNLQHTDRRITPDSIRNAGRPFWRQVRYPITETQERTTRNRFWNSVGYAEAANGWWIAWVPEHGYFEINVPPTYDEARLQRFWQAAPRQTRYVVVNSEGTLVQERSL